MKVEPNKFYKLRNGLKYRCYATDGGGDYPNHGAVFEFSGWVQVAHNSHGNFVTGDYSDCDIISDYDIVGEWVEPHPAENWTVDAKLYVSNDEINWYPKHFAMYRDELVYCWEFGTTSFSVDYGQIDLGWKYAKLAEE